MHLTHLTGADLNLLPSLAALLEERHVSRAARRVGLSQPAMSRAFQRLRSLLDDPLLIREKDRYHLTARAQAIKEQLDSLLPQLEALVSPQIFDPYHSEQRIDIAGTDYAATVYGGSICQLLLRESPKATIRFHSWRFETMADQIRTGTVDIGLYGGHVPTDLSVAQLATLDFACVIARDHPFAGGPHISLDEYLQYGHIIVDVTEGVQPDVDHRLQLLGTSRRPVVTLAYHSAVPAVVAGSTLVATVPADLAAGWANYHPVSVVPAPTEIATMPYQMTWHPAFDNDARHQWLRSIVQTAVVSISGNAEKI